MRPDFAPALVAGGRVALYERKYEAALDLLGAARALDPANPQIPVALRAAGRVRDGPSWKNSHEAKARRHRIITDISEGRGILAVQGPLACRVLEQILDARVTSLGRFDIAPIRTMGPEAC
ncbi:MAG: hypothetical protein HYY93_14020, partial [Planctomycetes bacterium]|nr:hypothetical protein [Planctomycetota bacterium]